MPMDAADADPPSAGREGPEIALRPIGPSIVRLKSVTKNEIRTSGLDVFDGTPLLDVKPYIKDLDSKQDANYGWLDDLGDSSHLALHIHGIPHDY